MKPLLPLRSFASAVLLGLALSAPAQNVTAPEVLPFDAVHWTRKGHVEDDVLAGKSCIRITNGELALRDPGFKNGTIDFDMAVEHNRYFPGMGFRMKDSADGEVWYLRPHQSGNPDAMQYYPEFNGADGWQLYYGPGFSQARIIPFRQWIHIHLVVKDSAAEMYLDAENKPAMMIPKLQRSPAAGYIVLTNAADNPAWFANFSYQKSDAVSMMTPPAAPIVLPVTRIMNWEISEPFDETRLPEKTGLSKTFSSALQWHPAAADERGIVNLSRFSAVKKGGNTVLARLIISATETGVRKLSFGFSDRARIFFNNRLLYTGADVFQSRDYRFLGTIGLFDAVYLPVRKGDNELLIAVSEDFGGWGLEGDLN